MAKGGACLQRSGQEGAADRDGYRRELAALRQQVDGGLPDGLDARAAGPPRIEGLLGVLQAEAAAPVHVRQSGGGRPAQTCTPTCTSQRASPSNLRCAGDQCQTLSEAVANTACGRERHPQDVDMAPVARSGCKSSDCWKGLQRCCHCTNRISCLHTEGFAAMASKERVAGAHQLYSGCTPSSQSL